MTDRIFITRRLPGPSISRLKERFEVEVWENEIPPTSKDILARASSCSGMITLLSDKIDASLIAQLPKLRAISQYAVGFDNIDISEATQRGIIVTNTPGVLTESTADLTWALILATSRRIVEANLYVRNGKWKVAWGPELLLGIDVHDATLGIVGMGRIGYAVAKRALGFDMRILYNSRTHTETTKQAEEVLGAERHSLESLLRESDIVSIHVPLIPETIGLISTRELSLMKRDAILINTSRGTIVDQDALYSALKEGKLRGAGLDVFQEEPTPTSNPLLKLPNVVALPHIGSASIRTRSRMAEMCVDNIMLALDGKTPLNIVNPEVLKE
ncbi:MAG: 2-hydroxyacid dehydrogenase [Candidatus Thorarchaeota archaeon]